MRNIKVSIIMPSLNVAEYIRECIESAINQTMDNIEILCVDAGSTDGTLEILQEYALKDSRIKIINSDRKSYGYQMNLGIQAAKGEYIGILETDDYILPDMYQTLCEVADENEIEVLKADYCIFVGDSEDRKFTYVHVHPQNDYYNKIIDPLTDFMAFKGHVVPWPGVYRRKFLEEKDIWFNDTPGASFQDNGFWLQVFFKARRVMFYNKPFYMLRRDNPNSSVKSGAKVYCGCDEYDYVRNTLRKSPELYAHFAPLCARYRYDHYQWTVDRLADEFKQEFLWRFSCDFRRLKAEGELDETLFTRKQLKTLNAIIEDPEEYYYKNILKSISPKRRLKKIEKSKSYRIGRLITWLPRKVKTFFKKSK